MTDDSSSQPAKGPHEGGCEFLLFTTLLVAAVALLGYCYIELSNRVKAIEAAATMKGQK